MEQYYVHTYWNHQIDEHTVIPIYLADEVDKEIAALQAEINSALYELKQIDEIECSLGVWDAVSNAISLLENE